MSNLDLSGELSTDLLVRFLRAEAGKFGFKRALLGLSGGVDSAVSAALAVRAYGAENVLGVMMPYKTSNPSSEADARAVAEQLEIPTRKIDISEMADGYLDDQAVEDRMRRGNVMARSRMIALYDQSVEWGGLVLGTSTKTEILLGYSTQWGDSASALNPLGDLYKHQVFQLAQHLKLPEVVINKAPSADLFEGQTDEEELGFSYEEVDRLLVKMIDERWTEEELVADGFEGSFIKLVANRIAANQYKRLPPIIAKLGPRSITHDFRYLRSWGH